MEVGKKRRIPMSETSKQVVAAYAKLHEYCIEKRIEYIVVREETGVYHAVLQQNHGRRFGDHH